MRNDFTLLISIFALGVSVLSYFTARKNFSFSHRPYAWVENFGYLNDKNEFINPPNQVIFRVLNSPAYITKEYFEYYTIDEKGNKTIVEKQEYKNNIRYPDDKSQYTNTSANVTDDIINSLKDNQELERIIKIDYSWLGFEKKYYFEANWRFDKESKIWRIVTQIAN
jgi:hypothetical protein